MTNSDASSLVGGWSFRKDNLSRSLSHFVSLWDGDPTSIDRRNPEAPEIFFYQKSHDRNPRRCDGRHHACKRGRHGAGSSADERADRPGRPGGPVQRHRRPELGVHTWQRRLPPRSGNR